MTSRRDRRHVRFQARKAWIRQNVVAVAVLGALVAAGTTVAAYRAADSGAAGPIVVTAAGDINNGSPSASAVATGNKVRAINPNDVVTVGDNAYDGGTDAQYAEYDKAWGSFKGITKPAPGNHEYDTGGQGYYNYFFGGQRTGNEYRSYEVGNGWLLISLNTEIPTNAGSPQETWLKGQLASHPSSAGWHIWAYGHKPLFTSPSHHGPNSAFAPLWADLDSAGADIVMFGHNHNYQRFAPMHSNGSVVGEGQAPREVICGTGGAGLYDISGVAAGNQYQDFTHHGVCRLGLYTDHWTMELDTTDGSGAGSALDSVSFPTRSNGVPPTTTTTQPGTTTTTKPVVTTTTTLPVGAHDCEGRPIWKSVTGYQSTEYRPGTIPVLQAIKAKDAVWAGKLAYPVTWAGSPGSCFQYGIVWGTWNWQTTSWDTFHHTGAFNLKPGPGSLMKDLIAVNYGDAFRIEGASEGFTLEHSLSALIHDDCIENDWNNGGIIKHNRCESSSSSYSARASAGQGSDGSNKTVSMSDNYFKLIPLPTVYKGPTPGNGGWFKMDAHSPMLRLFNNTFEASKVPNFGTLDLPIDKVAQCQGNTVIWRGGGAFPNQASWKKRCPDTVFLTP